MSIKFAKIIEYLPFSLKYSINFYIIAIQYKIKQEDIVIEE